MIRRAIILAGGLNTRVSELTQGRIPKILIPVGPSTILDHIIENLMLLGVHEFFIGVDGKFTEQFQQHLKRYDRLPHARYCRFRVIPESQPLGTGGGLLNVLNYHHFWNGFILVNGDGIAMLPGYQPTDRNEMVVCDVDNDGSYGAVDVSLHGKVRRFKGKQKGRGYINCGMYFIREPFFFKRPGDDHVRVVSCSFEDDLLPRFIEQCGMHTVLVESFNYYDWGTTQRIKEYQMHHDNS
jgi:NDP-sugar pyrophosphorylase family protein